VDVLKIVNVAATAAANAAMKVALVNVVKEPALVLTNVDFLLTNINS